jgi:hypothetical protein
VVAFEMSVSENKLEHQPELGTELDSASEPIGHSAGSMGDSDGRSCDLIAKANDPGSWDATKPCS